jgi:hypothetical protein
MPHTQPGRGGNGCAAVLAGSEQAGLGKLSLGPCGPGVCVPAVVRRSLLRPGKSGTEAGGSLVLLPADRIGRRGWYVVLSFLLVTLCPRLTRATSWAALRWRRRGSAGLAI